jgi:tRNA (cytidine/uridine-2'-O-)-methyltransferase
LDYWDAVDLWVHPNWFAFRDAMDRGRCLYFSAKAEQSYWEAPYKPNTCLVFGSETEGMPLRILEKHPERCFTIPMAGPVRSLNLANAVSIVLYEAIRQTRGERFAAEPSTRAANDADRTTQQQLATDEHG